MKHLFRVFQFIWRSEKKSIRRGIILAILVLISGTALLGLSGWFIVATGAAGLATGALGMAAAGMNVFGPSAGVRGLALGRTLTRYGERLLTHDATLRALATLRVRLLQSFAAAPYTKVLRLRGAETLNRLTADVDALDGIALRLVIPLTAGAVTLVLSFALIWALVGIAVAVWVIGGMLIGGVVAFRLNLRRAARPARLAEYALQAFRVRIIDLLRGQPLLLLSGTLGKTVEHTLEADERMRSAWLQAAEVERRGGFILTFSASLAAGGALYLGAELVRIGRIEPAFAALGFFVALGLAEVILPLQRGMAEIGRMMDAARRVAPNIELPITKAAVPHVDVTMNQDTPALELLSLQVFAPGEDQVKLFDPVSLQVALGQTVGLTGRSGAGKSTLLALVAGLLRAAPGEIKIAGQPIELYPEYQLRQRLGVLMQRSSLMRGSLREALAMAAPEAGEAAMLDVLEAVALGPVIAAKGGLSMRLGEAGSGLSGGEQRRLALARVLIRRPALLLLDEPCEGLDDTTAQIVLQGIRQICPDAAILIASHRPTEIEWCDKLFHLTK